MVLFICYIVFFIKKICKDTDFLVILQKILIIMSNFLQRTLSGAVYVAVVVASVMWAPVYVFSALMLVVTVLAVCEYGVLVGLTRYHRVSACVLAGLLFTTFACLNMPYPYGFYCDICGAVALCLFALLLPLLLVAEVFVRSERPTEVWGHLLTSQFMIALPLSLMPVIMSESRQLMMALFILIWVNDSGAYCVGSLLSKRKGGNHKMAPHVSPNKSWEGLFGGILFAVAAALVMAHFGWFFRLSTVFVGDEYAAAAVVALLVSVTGTFGDLVESLLKRSLGVKDSGRFLPGHGGVLDRFDSLLLATPAMALLVLLAKVFC